MTISLFRIHFNLNKLNLQEVKLHILILLIVKEYVCKHIHIYTHKINAIAVIKK